MSKYKTHTKRDHLNSITDCHLRNLKVNSTKEINEWFLMARNNKYVINKMDEAVELIQQFKNKVIFIFGDYDVDGITGTSIYYLTLKWIGVEKVFYDIPYRSDGFGVNKKMVDNALKILEKENKNPQDALILTVDNGSAAVNPINYAKELGFTVIITDHHEPYEEKDENGKMKVILPNADIIINPNAIPNSATFNGCCGAGVAYKLASKLLKDTNQITLLKPLATFGTFCDVMTLREENYVIAYQGLKFLNEHLEYNLPAFKALAKTLSISKWNGTSIGFFAGPCLNALERLENGAAKIGVQLLTTYDYEEALELSQLLVSYNEQRKKETEEGIERLESIIASMPDGPGYPVVIYVPNVKSGLVGILAGKLQEKYKAPAAVFTDGKEGYVAGSFRAPEGVNIKEHLDMIADKLDHYGGHAGAAGAGTKKEMFDEMVKALQATFPHVETAEEVTDLKYDLEISVNELEKSILENDKFEPMGAGNENLIFKVTGFKLLPVKGNYYGTTKKEGVRFKSATASAIGFGMTKYAKEIIGPCTLTLYGEISYNHWQKSNGKVLITPQINYIDFEVEQNSVQSSNFAMRLAQKAKNR